MGSVFGGSSSLHVLVLFAQVITDFSCFSVYGRNLYFKKKSLKIKTPKCLLTKRRKLVAKQLPLRGRSKYKSYRIFIAFLGWSYSKHPRHPDQDGICARCSRRRSTGPRVAKTYVVLAHACALYLTLRHLPFAMN